MARVTIDNLAAEVEKVLDEYFEEENRVTSEAVKEVTKLGVKAVKSGAGVFGGSGEYKSGWTSKVETGRISTQGVIYNAKMPGLPHLLEFGHAKVNGGRVPGRVHIAPVEDEIIRTLQEKLEASL